MKPKEKKPETIYRIIDRESGRAQGSYSRTYCDEFDFQSVNKARHSNVHGMYEDNKKYKISKYKVTYELIEDDCDGKEQIKKVQIRKIQEEDRILILAPEEREEESIVKAMTAMILKDLDASFKNLGSSKRKEREEK